MLDGTAVAAAVDKDESQLSARCQSDWELGLASNMHMGYLSQHTVYMI